MDTTSSRRANRLNQAVSSSSYLSNSLSGNLSAVSFSNHSLTSNALLSKPQKTWNKSSSTLNAQQISTDSTQSVGNRRTGGNRRQRSLSRWFNDNISDTGIRSTLVSRLVDGILDRADMLSIFNRAGDRGRVDSNEFSDLKTIVKNGNAFGMPQSVRILSGKVVFGDFANRSYQGSSLGNLTANSTTAHLNKLVGKHFLGSDRPATNYTYRQVSTPLFQDGISYQDVQQGRVGSCYFLSSLSAIALKAPQQIQSMFTDNGDGTYTVRFYKDNGAADYVTVDNALPVNGAGQSVYASYAQETWVALAEKAYAQWNESGAGRTSYDDWDMTNRYMGIESGYCHAAMSHITNQKTDWNFISNSTADTVVNTFNAGQLVAFSSKQGLPDSGSVVGSHAYTMTGYNAATQKFTLYNPWGVDTWDGVSTDANPQDGQIELTWNEVNQYFNHWSYTV